MISREEAEAVCRDGCVVVELALGGYEKVLNCTAEDDVEEMSRDEIRDNFCSHLEHYKCFQDAIVGFDYGHINYAVAAYCVENNHLNCLKTLHKTGRLMWHNHLAMLALEHGNLPVLQYIVENMGDYRIDEPMSDDICAECRKYVESKNVVGRQMPLIK